MARTPLRKVGREVVGLLTLGVCLAFTRHARARAEETLEPVVVSGSPEETAPQQGPASTPVLTDEDVKSAVIDRTADIAIRAPNLVLREGAGRSTPSFSIRGIVNASLGEPTVGLYVDGLPYTDLRFRLL